jgi:hypothetical protein
MIISPPLVMCYILAARPSLGVARSSTEAGYKALADTVSELLWVLSLFTELGHTSSANPVIYYDNLDATHLSANHVFHSRMKHIALAYHFFRLNFNMESFEYPLFLPMINLLIF